MHLNLNMELSVQFRGIQIIFLNGNNFCSSEVPDPLGMVGRFVLSIMGSKSKQRGLLHLPRKEECGLDVLTIQDGFYITSGSQLRTGEDRDCICVLWVRMSAL